MAFSSLEPLYPTTVSRTPSTQSSSRCGPQNHPAAISKVAEGSLGGGSKGQISVPPRRLDLSAEEDVKWLPVGCTTKEVADGTTKAPKIFHNRSFIAFSSHRLVKCELLIFLYDQYDVRSNHHRHHRPRPSSATRLFFCHQKKSASAMIAREK